MEGIWVYSEDIRIAKQMLNMGAELAASMQQPLCALTIKEADAADLIACGASKVFVLKGENDWPEAYAQAVADLAQKENPSVIFVGATLRGKDLAAKVAALLKTGLVTDANDVRFVDGAVETDRMMYGGLAVRTEVLNGLNLVTIPPRRYEMAAADASRTGDVVTVDAATGAKVAVSNVAPIVREGADVTTADKLVCVGRGLGKQEDMKLAEDLAAAIKGEIGCTRSIAEEYHWLPVETYIGLSGANVKPSLYISMGVSGQVQHVAGIRDSKIIVAIDMNENAPIFAAADYGIVGDLYEVTPLLTEAIKKAVS